MSRSFCLYNFQNIFEISFKSQKLKASYKFYNCSLCFLKLFYFYYCCHHLNYFCQKKQLVWINSNKNVDTFVDNIFAFFINVRLFVKLLLKDSRKIKWLTYEHFHLFSHKFLVWYANIKSRRLLHTTFFCIIESQVV